MISLSQSTIRNQKGNLNSFKLKYKLSRSISTTRMLKTYNKLIQLNHLNQSKYTRGLNLNDSQLKLPKKFFQNQFQNFIIFGFFADKLPQISKATQKSLHNITASQNHRQLFHFLQSIEPFILASKKLPWNFQ